ncbi:MAG TPA: serpin family protein [Pirellulales bacterium]|nr:serpin family protein [Pirellulales bacterium]
MRQTVSLPLRLALVVVIAVLGACTAEPPPRVFDAAEITVTEEARKVAAQSNEFAFDLYGQLRQKDGNLFFSPASVSAALAMTYAGAGGQTKEEMTQVLHLDAPDEQVHQGFGELVHLLNSNGERYQLRMASRLWGLEGYPFRPEFVKLTRDEYGAGLAQVNFNRPDKAARTINDWIGKQTEGKIGQLISPNMIEPLTRLVLTNAIYFKAAWQDEFWKRATESAPFHLSGEEQTDAPLMRQLEHFSYAETDDAQLLELPYVGNHLSMVVLLPKQADGLAGLEETMTAEKLDRWLAEGKSRRVEVFLPRFKITSQLPLKDALKALGMTRAFSEDADFSGMTSFEDLKLYAVIHAAFVNVDEEGTEAAAATAVMKDAAAAPPREDPPVVFRADHPFLFLIRDNRTGAILFLGRLTNPKSP